MSQLRSSAGACQRLGRSLNGMAPLMPPSDRLARAVDLHSRVFTDGGTLDGVDKVHSSRFRAEIRSGSVQSADTRTARLISAVAAVYAHYNSNRNR
jgi:hypothetical protein